MPQMATPITSAAASCFGTPRWAELARSQKKIDSAAAEAATAISTEAPISSGFQTIAGDMSSAAMPM